MPRDARRREPIAAPLSRLSVSEPDHRLLSSRKACSSRYVRPAPLLAEAHVMEPRVPGGEMFSRASSTAASLRSAGGASKVGDGLAA